MSICALPTHLHPLGIEGAQVLALAVALCSRMERFDHGKFFETLISACRTAEYRTQLQAASQARGTSDLEPLGNQIEALYSVPTAIASFALTPNSYEATIADLIFSVETPTRWQRWPGRCLVPTSASTCCRSGW